MILRIINAILAFLTRPFFYIQQYFLLAFQMVLPTNFDEKTWYIFFGFLTFLVLAVAYALSRFVTIKDADEDPVYQRAKFYSIQRRHQKTT
jgi:hypothetical protein